MGGRPLYLAPRLGGRLRSLLDSPALLHTLTGALGSPLNVVIPDQLAENLKQFRSVYGRHRLPGQVLFAHKANQSSALLRRLAATDAGIDVASLGEPGWSKALGLDRPLDAAVSTAALHYLSPDTLHRVYRQLAGLLRLGGVFVNGDHFPQDDTVLAGVAACVGRRRAERRHAFAHEDWASWWTAVAADPELADLLAERRNRLPASGTDSMGGMALPARLRLLRQAGFGHVGPVWQYGDSCVVVAIR